LAVVLAFDDDDESESYVRSPALTARNSHECAGDTLW